ncbi:TIR domain-containing protein [Kitasatospora sp. CB01950]|uniref:TIR domain-containing protein n=1 Tax=Kitasatospora sp. CB01950 TaxID=1703930 RepID=UPI0009398326|nr:TIR domain-containing protein [Kitasatospora sp. CB01950]
MSLVFVNYRTGDEEAVAALLDHGLSHRFGSERVFRACKSIAPGRCYPQELIAAVRSCPVLLAVIGPRWFDVRGRDGRAAVEDPEDWPCREIAEAFAAGALVVPVLVGATPRLRPERLPEPLAALAHCQYRRLDLRTSHADLTRIADELACLVPELADVDEVCARCRSVSPPWPSGGWFPGGPSRTRSRRRRWGWGGW